ncbi:uncharacterized protein APUU_60419A [Aspergillus puulaauensis]|uniref:BZIP domain-containing protein n=1 Tax=Aspergillus puulaauensis TaxID=1220207 RepID=A0A7R8AQG1_9EURO|nr:uncharacterized protein APUU_60419A [Aspergillus puulaauensis]BCS27371.1 hypothetical protein APUU_60419A [Aspergillus puulaauensis]
MAASESTCANEAAGDAKRLRKRLQNRLNQRAFRSRHQNREGPKSKKPRKNSQYQINRWRLDEQVGLSAETLSKATNTGNDDHTQDSSPDHLSRTAWLPLPVDHRLLHLVQYNVFRGLGENKSVLQQLTMQYCINNESQTEPLSDYTKFPNYSVILPKTSLESTFMGSLAPTTSQRNIAHSSWINYIPFPTLRENLIKWEFAFDHSELVKDLVGDLINSHIFLSIPSGFSEQPVLADKHNAVQETSNGATFAPQAGLIVWGEPYRAENWEATPDFLRKWAWALVGCQELINSTNHWRRIRGERTLRLVSVDGVPAP